MSRLPSPPLSAAVPVSLRAQISPPWPPPGNGEGGV
jgi:hypothetical protein